ncbi:MAG: NAD(P)-binding domain-containing protein [Pseudomonadota bacterium]
MRRLTTVIIGAGQAGLAMSRELMHRGVDHLVIERGAVANAWRKDRWDSLRLLTPNWANYLPGAWDLSLDPDGYMSVAQLVSSFDAYARKARLPVQGDTEVIRVRRSDNGYYLETSQGPVACRTLVLATGACARPSIPALFGAVPSTTHQATPLSYKRPNDLPDGGVLIVGASATGVQLARELQTSGRQVTLAVGNHVRMPRIYRSYDIEWWLHAIGVMDERIDDVDDLERVRRLPSPQLIGGSQPVDLNALQDLGVEIVGRLATIRDGQALFSGGLANVCTSADLKMGRLLDSIDAWVDDWQLGSVIPPSSRPEPTRVPSAPRLTLNLANGEVRTILWATGYRSDFSWLDVPVFDRRGRLRHRGGVVDAPGLYVLGLPFLRRRKSHQISGAGDDASALSFHLRAFLDGRTDLAA